METIYIYGNKHYILTTYFWSQKNLQTSNLRPQTHLILKTEINVSFLCRRKPTQTWGECAKSIQTQESFLYLQQQYKEITLRETTLSEALMYVALIISESSEVAHS